MRWGRIQTRLLQGYDAEISFCYVITIWTYLCVFTGFNRPHFPAGSHLTHICLSPFYNSGLWFIPTLSHVFCSDLISLLHLYTRLCPQSKAVISSAWYEDVTPQTSALSVLMCSTWANSHQIASDTVYCHDCTAWSTFIGLTACEPEVLKRFQILFPITFMRSPLESMITARRNSGNVFVGLCGVIGVSLLAC